MVSQKQNKEYMTDKKLFRTIIHRSWNLIWKRPSMWVLAFLAAPVVGIGVIDGLIGSARLMFKALHVDQTLIFTCTEKFKICHWLLPPYDSIMLPIFAIFAIVIAIFLFLVSTVSLGALIRAATDKKEHSIESAWNAGVKHMWELVAFVLTRHILIHALFIGTFYVGQWLFTFSTSPLAMLGLVVLALAFMLLVLIINFLTLYAMTAAVVDRSSYGKAIKRGLYVFRHHILLSLEMALVVLVAEIMFAFIGVLAALLIAMPVFMFYIIAGITGYTIFLWVAASVGLILLMILLFIVLAWAIQFGVSSWAHLYTHTKKGNIKARILHHFGH